MQKIQWNCIFLFGIYREYLQLFKTISGRANCLSIYPEKFTRIEGFRIMSRALLIVKLMQKRKENCMLLLHRPNIAWKRLYKLLNATTVITFGFMCMKTYRSLPPNKNPETFSEWELLFPPLGFRWNIRSVIIVIDFKPWLSRSNIVISFYDTHASELWNINASARHKSPTGRKIFHL